MGTDTSPEVVGGQARSRHHNARIVAYMQSHAPLRHAACGLAVAVILDEMSARRMWSRQLVNYRTGRVAVLGKDRGVAAQWIVANYGYQVGLTCSFGPRYEQCRHESSVACQASARFPAGILTGRAHVSPSALKRIHPDRRAKWVWPCSWLKRAELQSSLCSRANNYTLSVPLTVCSMLQVTMVILMAVCAAMMGAFLGYHLWLLRAGMTTNETFKWRDLRLALGEQLCGGTDDDADADGSAVTGGGNRGGKHVSDGKYGRCGSQSWIEKRRKALVARTRAGALSSSVS